MPSRLPYAELAPEGVAPMRAVEHYLNASTALSPVLLELVRLRCSQVNGCEFCIGHHTNELRKHHEPESRIEALGAWENSDAFTARERAALAWAESVTKIETRHAADPEYAAISRFFQAKDLVDLTMAVASINAWNRLSIAFRAEWDPSRHKWHTGDGQPGGNSIAIEPSPAEPSPEDVQSAADGNGSAAAKPETAPMQDAVDDDGGKVAQD